MPIYEYRCEECYHTFELLEGFGAGPVKRCGKCGGEARRVISTSSFILKGSGWYLTDYARKEKGNGKDRDVSKEKKETSTSS